LPKSEYISLGKVRMEFFKYVKKLSDLTVKHYAYKFFEFRTQKLYLVFKSENKLIFSLASKRGNTKYIRKIETKMEQLKQVFIKHAKINRDYSNVIFVTLTFNRSKFLNPVYTWVYLSEYVNDYISNLNKKLKKYNNKIILFVKTYELHRDYYPHVHMILLLKNPIRTFFWKNKKRIAIKKKKMEWNKGFTDVFAPNNPRHICNYLTKYITKNYFNQSLKTNKSDLSIEKNNKTLEDKSNTLLCILWLFRKHTISHSRRLDNLNHNIKQINVTPSPTKKFIGLIIIDYSITFLTFIQKNYKIKEIEYFEIEKNQKYIIIKNTYVQHNINYSDMLARGG